MVISSLRMGVMVLKITMIPAKNDMKIPKIKKVAAYCRVSTEEEMQRRSLENQSKYYEAHIKKNPMWVFAGVYVDNATGRNDKRKNFQRMITDCYSGKIDLILIKSISRFGRNTLQTLIKLRELSLLGIEVYFEVEKIYISDERAEKMITIYSSLAQEESISKSFATSWGIRTRFREGTSQFANLSCYGYRKNNGTLEIDSLEADVVKHIFIWREEGISLRGISEKLHTFHIPSPKGHERWQISTISNILKNEKYYGDVLLQKTYLKDYFEGKRCANSGQLPKYLIKNHHEAIIN